MTMTLVIGATGMLGGEICRLLAEQSRLVRALVRETSNPDRVAADRLVLCTALAAMALLAWTYLVYHARAMSDMASMAAMPAMAEMADMAMPAMGDWSGVDLVLLFAMWAIMMLGMMAPAASPRILLVAAVSRQRSSSGPVPRALAFAAGYFSRVDRIRPRRHVGARGGPADAHDARDALRGRHAAPRRRSLSVGAAEETVPDPLPFAAGVPHRSLARWLDGRALAMGARHGVYCVGCCWMLMALLFVVGVMNLLSVAAITAFVFVERLAPRGDIVGRLAGMALVMAGLVLMLR
jgi:predicted metal-binding membrane protein